MAEAPSFDYINQSTDELRRYWGRAIRVGEKSSYGKGYSFSVLLLTFLTCQDSVSRWFQDYTGWLRNDPNTVRIKEGLTKLGLNDGISEVRLTGVQGISDDEAEKVFRDYGMPTDLSGSAEGILRRAVEYLQDDMGAVSSVQQTNAEPLDVRHLMGVLIYDQAGHKDDIQAANLNPEDWSISFLQNVIRAHYRSELGAWMERHVRAFQTTPDIGPEPPLPLDARGERLMGYSSDTVDAKALDLIGIDEDVYPLAALIAAHSTQPPLSIGVFGDWGSGKTFFMNRLKQRVSAISAKARSAIDETTNQPKLQREVDFYKHIIQIDFNAWHFVGGNLWAALAENIFLRLQENNVSTLDFKSSSAKRADITTSLDKLEAEQSTANTAVEAAQEKLDKVQTELVLARQTAAAQPVTTREIFTAAASDPALQDELTKELEPLLEALHITTAGKNLNQLYDEVKKVRTAVALGQTLLPRFNRWQTRLYVLLTLVVAPVIAILIGALVKELTQSELVAQLGSILSGLSALIGGFAMQLRNQTQAATDWIDKIEQRVQDFEQKAAEKVKTDPNVVKLERQMEEANASLSAAQQENQTIIAEMERLHAEAEALEPPRLISALIQERMDSGDYRKHLGITALIRRDFEKLESEIVNTNKNVLAEDATLETEDEVKLNRIVLYIDDLDRCPPDVVAQVLQAVHLLLAFNLFVVVVGVDARWVSRALQKKYPDLLPRPARGHRADGSPNLFAEHTASPHDYLEKIFQIPLWLEPINVRGTQNLIHAMLKGSITKRTAAAMTGAGGTLGRQGAAELGQTPIPDGTGGTSDDGGGEAQVDYQPPPPPEPELVAKNLEITREELRAMDQLAAINGRSPRSVKRFVNCYRLVKACLREGELETYIAKQEYRPIMLLLSVVSGMPDLSTPLFRSIARRADAAATQITVNEGVAGTLKNIIDDDFREPKTPEQERLKAWLDGADGAYWQDMPVEELRRYIERVARYSFQIDRL